MTIAEIQSHLQTPSQQRLAAIKATQEDFKEAVLGLMELVPQTEHYLCWQARLGRFMVEFETSEFYGSFEFSFSIYIDEFLHYPSMKSFDVETDDLEVLTTIDFFLGDICLELQYLIKQKP